MDIAFEKEKYQSFYKFDFQFLHRCVTILQENSNLSSDMNLGNRFVNVIQKSLLIDIQLSYKEVIGIIFMETAL